MLTALLWAGLGIVAAALFWRYVWFFRDPLRRPPEEAGIVSPADGTVVYVRRVGPGEDVVVVKRGVAATVRDILKEDTRGEKLVIGIFMSPLDVHYNRAPLSGRVEYVRHYPADGKNVHMGAMHWRVLLRRPPFHAGSRHIIQNERKVTCLAGRHRGEPLRAYVVQIGARTVNGIDSYFRPGEFVGRGETFGMIRIGSQVDLVLPWRDTFELGVSPGDRVRAGESLLVR